MLNDEKLELIGDYYWLNRYGVLNEKILYPLCMSQGFGT